MLQPRQQQWRNILQITEQLYLLSADENWQAMTELEAMRLSQLEVFFSTPVAEMDADEIKAGLQQIQKSDELIKKHCALQQQNISNSIKKISTGQQVIQAYTHFS